MSERLERWRARDRIQSDLGPLAMLIGFIGLLAFAGPLLGLEVKNAAAGLTIPAPLWGGCLLLCAWGLWRVHRWARWTTLLLCAALWVPAALELVLDGPLLGLLHPGMLLLLLAIIYLLLPSTRRLFARAQGALQRAETS